MSVGVLMQHGLAFGLKRFSEAEVHALRAISPRHLVSVANVNDGLLLRETLEAIDVARPCTRVRRPQHLCLDNGL